jgi:ABC-type transport system involved in cytochrome c biogenesis ATPase subunit
MSLINVSNLTFSYDGSYDNIFEDVSFQIDTDWKLGFIGRNGRGKTTFLKLLMGEYEYSGSISASVEFEYFPYEVEDKTRFTIDVMNEICPECMEWEKVKELSLLDVEEDILYRPFATLSNGEQTKVLLASMFLRRNCFLLLDEPTNHLDIDSCNFDVTGYAVRSGQTTGNIRTLGAVNINNSILTSNSPGIGTIVLRGDSTNNINIIHSNITNNEGGPYIQNENDDSIHKYDIDLIESNVSGQVDRIATATMSIIDAPNVKNGPICVQSSNGNGDNGNGDNGNDLITMLLTIILVVLAIVLIAILLPFIVAIFIIRRLLPR